MTASRETQPHEIYSTRLAALTQLQTADGRREKLLGYSKLAVAALALLSALAFLHYLKFLWYLAIPIVAFAILAVLHDQVLRRIRTRVRAIDFYTRGLARLEDRWSGSGENGDRFLDPMHPYARDLDIFGSGSLFELLCTARTRAGEETLARWLLAPAPIEEIRARNAAINDFKTRTAFREQLFCQGETVRLGVYPDRLSAWGERPPIFGGKGIRLVTRVLAALWLLSLVYWAVSRNGDAVLAFSFLSAAWSHHILKRSDAAAASLEQAADDLELLSGTLQFLEQEQFHAPRLIALQNALKQSATAPSAAIRRLRTLVDYLHNRHSLFLRPFDIVTFWSTQLVFAAEVWQQEFGHRIRAWLTTLGELEALAALAGYAFEHPSDVFPELEEDGAVFDAESLAHPLLPASKVISNNLRLDAGLQLIVLSGPNMAGKSTFIRAVGVNAVLAQCGAPVRAARLRISPLTVAASICVLDSLSGGVSRFYAEIHRLKLITDLAGGAVPVLFLLDELLSGTNSHDRLAGSEFLVQSLVDLHAIGMISTHDLALARIPGEMPGRAANFHFEDRFDDGKLIFDYKLKPGIVKTSNALELMRSIGLKVGGPGL